jgi:Zn-dependent oligopeptidase
LVKNRQKLAHILGYKSFAHKFLCNKIIKTPEGVHSFLSNISDVIKPKAQKELQILIDLKKDLIDGKLIDTDAQKSASGM